MARGNRRENIFLCDDDRHCFIKTLGDACERTGWFVHAWVLMDNHYHLMVETPEPNLVEGMRWLQNTYTRRLNTRHGLWGRVFGDRYKSVLVQNDKGHYFSTLMDYIHLNPARAGLVATEESVVMYPWSSLSMAYGRSPGNRPVWSAVVQGLNVMGLEDNSADRRMFVGRLDLRARQEADPGFIPLPKDADARTSHLRRGWYWGSQEFADSALQASGERKCSSRNTTYRSGMVSHAHDLMCAEEIVSKALECLGLSHDDLDALPGSDARKLAIAFQLSKRTSVRQEWIAEQLKMKSASNVSQQLRRLRDAKRQATSEYSSAAKKLSEFFD